MLDDTTQEWLYLFTRGKAPATYTPSPEIEGRKKIGDDDIRVGALKIAEMNISVKKVAAVKEDLKKGLTHTTEVNGKKVSTMGPQDKSLDVEEVGKAKSIESMKETTEASKKAIGTAFGESQRLRELTVKRLVWDEKTGATVQKTVRLFEDEDITRDFFTPLVREELVPETVVPDRYSATQKMIDGSNDPYIEECISKGKEPARGLADLGKGVVSFSVTIATEVAGPGGNVAMITDGIALAIGVGIDGIETAIEWKEEGFNPDSLSDIGDNIAGAVNKLVSGATGNDNLGAFVSGIVLGGTSVLKGSARAAAWAVKRKGGSTEDFPFGDLFDDFIGGASAAMSSLSAKDQGAKSVGDTIGQQLLKQLPGIRKSGLDLIKKLHDLPPREWGPAFT